MNVALAFRMFRGGSVERHWGLEEGKGDPEMNIDRRQETLLPVGS